MINFIKKMLDRSVQNIMSFEDNHSSNKKKKKKKKKKSTRYGKWEGNL